MIGHLQRRVRQQTLRPNKASSIRSASVAALLATVSASLLGCTGASSFRTSSSDVATIVAATFSAAAAASASAPATVTSVPTDTPTQAPPTPESSPRPARRINVLPDATSATLTGRIQSDEVQLFIMHAELGQPLLVQAEAAGRDLALSIRTQGGTVLLSAAARQSTWRGTLPQTEDYYIEVHGGKTAQDLRLTVRLARKIRFKEGAASAKILDKTAGGSVMVYSVLGVQGQKLEVGLSGVGNHASLSVSGYVDGESYLWAEDDKTSFILKIAVTQDYIIEVVPKDSRALDYALAVQVQ